MSEKLKNCLESGGSIHYAAVSGGLCLMQHGSVVKDIPFSIEDFLDLKKQNTIEQTGYMGQGHSVFHGRVWIYTLKKEGQ